MTQRRRSQLRVKLLKSKWGLVTELEQLLAVLFAGIRAGDESAFLKLSAVVAQTSTFYLLGAGVGLEGPRAADVAKNWVLPITASAHSAKPPYLDWLIHRIENTIHHEYFENAVKLQKRLYCDLPPLPKGVEACVRIRPRHRVTGDFVFASASDDEVLFVLGDIVNHGVAAALSGSIMRQHVFQAHKDFEGRKTKDRIEGMVSRLHGELTGAGLNNHFVPAVIALANVKERTIHILNCGSHATPIHIRDGKASLICDGDNDSTVMLGFPVRPTCNLWEATIFPGDVFLFVSDGIVDQSEDFDRHQLRALAESLSSNSPDILADGILLHLDRLEVTHPQSDDQAIVAISFVLLEDCRVDEGHMGGRQLGSGPQFG